MKIRQFLAGLALIGIGIMSGSAGAAVVSVGSSPPAVGDGIENLNFSTDSTNATAHPFVDGDYIGSASYYGNGSGFALGQTFTTGANDGGYNLTSISVRQISWGPTDWHYTNGSVSVRVWNSSGSADLGWGYDADVDTLFFETNAVVGGSGDVVTGGTPSTPQWLTVTFDSPLSLDANTLYGFAFYSEGDPDNGGFFMEWDGRNDNPYLEGASLTTEPAPTGNLYWYGDSTSDRSFVASMEANTVLPPFYPIVVSPTGTGVSNPVTLSAEITEWGATYVSSSMELNGSPVPTTELPAGNVTTITYDAGILSANTTYTGKVVAVGSTGNRTNEWTFTMAPPLTVVSTSPSGAGAPAIPQLVVYIANGASQLDTGSSLELYLDDTPLTPLITPDTPVVGQTEIVGNWPTELEVGSTHTGKVVYAGINPAAGPFTETWTFAIEGDPGYGIYIHSSSNGPIPDADDQYQFVYSTTNDANVSDGGATYVGDNHPARGQTFTTGPSSVELSSVWLQHVPTNYLSWRTTGVNFTEYVRITDPSQAGTSNFVLHTESLVVITNGGMAVTGGYTAGSGAWFEFRLQTPITLSANKEYGFDVGTGPLSEENEYWETAGTNTSVYAGGTAYSSGDGSNGLGNNTMTTDVGDRVFFVKLAPVGPTLPPNIQSISVSGGSVTLTWDSELGGNYGVMSKSSLTDGTWTEVTNVPGAAGSTMATVPAASTEEFFQIEGN